MNFARDVVDAAPAGRRALVVVDAERGRREWTFGMVADAAARLAGRFAAAGVGRGDVVLILTGSRVEWALSLVACFRLGAVALPCNEQLRAADLRLRLLATRPALVVCDRRDREQLDAAGPDCPVLTIPDRRLLDHAPAPAVELAGTDPALIVFTSGTGGEPKPALHGQRYLTGQRLQAEHWLALGRDDLHWCTASSGWSKSARNGFVAAWLVGASALLHDGRFDAEQRLELAERERVTSLCMAPTEYRLIADRCRLRRLPHLRSLVAAGEALDAATLERWRDATGLAIRDGYGQTETGQLTAAPPGEPVRPGSMGRPLPGMRLWIDDGELVLDPSSDPTFFLGYLGEPAPAGPWRTGDRVVKDADGWLWFQSRADDVIVSAGYRIGPAEVEEALRSHPAVADVAAVAAPDPIRGHVVRAVVVAADGHAPGEELAAALQAHARAVSAPYKYPRIVEFRDALPRTASGKLQRALLRDEPAG
jgi:acyl-coenzyme A synthetase/AMP-(fatty) acid ligase